MEKHLGIGLFNRTNNGVALTATGLAYYQEIEPALSRIDKATRTLTYQHGTQSLRVSLLSSLSTLWLIPVLDSFHALHPEITLELQEDVEEIDFRNDTSDAAIRYDFHQVGQWKGLTTVALAEELIFPVCSESYLEQVGPLTNSATIKQHKLLVNSRHPDEWDQWFASVNFAMKTSDFKSVSVMDTSNMTLAAAANGLGIALGRTPFVNRLLETHNLVPAHSSAQNRGIRNYLVYPEATTKLPQLTKFAQWLKSLPEQSLPNSD